MGPASNMPFCSNAYHAPDGGVAHLAIALNYARTALWREVKNGASLPKKHGAAITFNEVKGVMHGCVSPHRAIHVVSPSTVPSWREHDEALFAPSSCVRSQPWLKSLPISS